MAAEKEAYRRMTVAKRRKALGPKNTSDFMRQTIRDREQEREKNRTRATIRASHSLLRAETADKSRSRDLDEPSRWGSSATALSLPLREITHSHRFNSASIGSSRSSQRSSRSDGQEKNPLKVNRTGWYNLASVSVADHARCGCSGCILTWDSTTNHEEHLTQHEPPLLCLCSSRNEVFRPPGASIEGLIAWVSKMTTTSALFWTGHTQIPPASARQAYLDRPPVGVDALGRQQDQSPATLSAGPWQRWKHPPPRERAWCEGRTQQERMGGRDPWRGRG